MSDSAYSELVLPFQYLKASCRRSAVSFGIWKGSAMRVPMVSYSFSTQS